MKKILLYLLVAASIISCSKDETVTTDIDAQNLTYQQATLDLSKAIPNPALDNTNKGLYVGTLATTDLSFHEKIFINIENDGDINAQIITPDATLAFKGQQLRIKGNVYLFKGKIGSFMVALENNEAIVTAATFYNQDAVINLIKSTSTSRGISSLGSFTSSDNILNGTWDMVWNQTGLNSFESSSLSIIRFGGGSFVVPLSSPATYSRVCMQVSPGPTIPEDGFLSTFLYVSTGTATLLGQPLTHNLSGNGEVFFVPFCAETQNGLEITSNSWSWNGQTGTVTIDAFSLPEFIPGT